MPSSEDDKKLNHLFKMSFYKKKNSWKTSRQYQPENEKEGFKSNSGSNLEENPQSSDDHASDQPVGTDSNAVNTVVEKHQEPILPIVLPESSRLNFELECPSQGTTQKETASYRLHMLVKLTKEAGVVQSSLNENILNDDSTSDNIVHQSQDDEIPKHLLEVAEAEAGGSSASGHIEANGNIFSHKEPLLYPPLSCSVEDIVVVDSSGDSEDCKFKQMDLALNSGCSPQPNQLELRKNTFAVAEEANSSTSSSSSFVSFMRHVHGAHHSSAMSLQYKDDANRTMSEEELAQLSTNQLEKGIACLSNQINMLIREYQLRKKEQPAPEIIVETKSRDGKLYYCHFRNNATWTRPQDTSPDYKVITPQETGSMEIAVNPFLGDDPDRLKNIPTTPYPINPIDEPINQNVMGDLEKLMGNLGSVGQLGSMSNPCPVSNQPSYQTPIDISEITGYPDATVHAGPMENPGSVSNPEAAVNTPEVFPRSWSGWETISSGWTYRPSSDDITREGPKENPGSVSNPEAAVGRASEVFPGSWSGLETISSGWTYRTAADDTLREGPKENPGSVSNPEAAVGRAPEVFPGPWSGLETISSGWTYRTAADDTTREDEASQRIPVLDETRPVLSPKSSQQADTQPQQAQRARKVPYVQAMADPEQDIMELEQITNIYKLHPAKRICTRRYTK